MVPTDSYSGLNSVNVERHYPLRCWIGTGDWRYACFHHVLSVRAFKLRQSSKESGEERLMTLDSSPSPAANLLGTSMRQFFSVLVLSSLGTEEVVCQELLVISWPLVVPVSITQM